MKRVTIYVFAQGEFADALSLTRFLKARGVDAGIVTKHAVQVHPDHAVKAAELLPKYKWGWDRKKEEKADGK